MSSTPQKSFTSVLYPMDSFDHPHHKIEDQAEECSGQCVAIVRCLPHVHRTPNFLRAGHSNRSAQGTLQGFLLHTREPRDAVKSLRTLLHHCGPFAVAWRRIELRVS